MGWLNEWAALGTKHAENAANRRCEGCGGRLTVGYSNMGIPIPACPTCHPDRVAMGQRSFDSVFGER